jgi:hypothetical protein
MIAYQEPDDNFMRSSADGIQMRSGKVISVSKVKGIAHIKSNHG